MQVVDFDAANYNGGIMLDGKQKPSMLGVEADDPKYQRYADYGRTMKLQCFPLQAVLAALEFPHIDYFSLDIEGAEFVVLDSLDWSKFNMTMLSIEINHAGDIFPGDRKDIRDLMEKNGFKWMGLSAIDDFYYKKENNRFLKKKKKCPKK